MLGLALEEDFMDFDLIEPNGLVRGTGAVHAQHDGQKSRVFRDVMHGDSRPPPAFVKVFAKGHGEIAQLIAPDAL